MFRKSPRLGVDLYVTDTWKLDRFAALERGENPMLMTRMKSGYAVIGDTQFLPGYCVLLAYPRVSDLSDLSFAQRQDFLLDMSLIVDALQAVCRPIKVNYAIYGNTDPFLHAHVFPRYGWEPDERRTKPVWQYPPAMWTAPEHQYADERHGAMREEIKRAIQRLMGEAY